MENFQLLYLNNKMRLVFEISKNIKRDADKALQNAYFEKWNYKILFHLWDLEEELNSHSGLIVIPALDSGLPIEIIGFERKIAEKIYKVLKPVCYPE